MVDLHKGFEGFERLGPRSKKKKEEEEKEPRSEKAGEEKEISLSKGAEKEDISLSKKEEVKEERKEDISLSKEAEEADLSLSQKSDLAKAESVYDNILQYVTSVLNKVEAGKEDQIKGEEILGKAGEFTDQFLTSVNSDDLVRLIFQRDDYEDNYLYTHSVNVCLLSVRMALALNFSKSKLTDLVIASLFHDIGMMKVPMDIWNHERPLRKREYIEVQKHVEYGERIFKKLSGINEAISSVIGQHQERCDGSGYPRGLTKEEIHYGARLIGLMDRYEANTHTRLFRPRMLPDKAIQQILDEESHHFDNHFLKVMLRHISIFPIGAWVRISSGEVGNVIRVHENVPMRPVLKVCYDREGNPLRESRLLDLSKQLLIHVECCIDIKELQKEEF
ncbi:MAG: HD-GYP domain-containing protein [Candidatus Omnitrophota bacterium]